MQLFIYFYGQNNDFFFLANLLTLMSRTFRTLNFQMCVQSNPRDLIFINYQDDKLLITYKKCCYFKFIDKDKGCFSTAIQAIEVEHR